MSKRKLRIPSVGLVCTSPIFLDPNRKSATLAFRLRFPAGLFVPCGKCVACRKQRSLAWAIRLEREMPYHEYALFVTLTYDDEHVPEHYSLKRKHLTDFFKRLRYFLGGRQIKYYAAGEYGERFHRPHYHAIIFDLSHADEEIVQKAWY